MACPKCGQKLAQKYGKNGSFIACTGYPECSFTSDYERDAEGKVRLVERSGTNTDISCEKCGSEMVIKRSRYGEILACSAYPECKNIKNFMRLPDGSLKVLATGEKLGEKCPECSDGEVVLKSGRNGLFAACSRYPECKFTANIQTDDSGRLTVKRQEAAAEMGTCEKCGKPMVVKRGFRGPFLACSGYPECKNTKSMTAKTAAQKGPAKKAASKKAPVGTKAKKSSPAAVKKAKTKKK
jgi:DNA topoisomerase-1